VEINPKDAEELEVSEGETLILASRRGEIEIPARISTAVPHGTVFVPIHFGENPTNYLTNPAFDPLAKIPEFKVGAVHIKKLWT
jgi:predicted molibdopterin-dependent oxidoreductase YjgC